MIDGWGDDAVCFIVWDWSHLVTDYDSFVVRLQVFNIRAPAEGDSATLTH